MIHALMAAALAVTFQQTDTTMSVRPNGRLSLDSHTNGRVVVRGWDRNEMRIRARHDRRTELQIDREGSSVAIEPEGRRGAPGNVDFDITVPRAYNIEIDVVNSDVDIAEVTGDISAETVNGSVSLSRITGRIQASSIQGTVTVRDSRGSLDAESTNEAIEVSNHTGDVNVENVNGDIALSGIHAGAVTAETVNGSVVFDGELRANGNYDLSTHNGSIVVVVPQGTNANVSVETFRGELESDFPISFRNMGGEKRMTFVIGNGGARLQLASFGGNIRLRRPGARVERNPN